MATGKDYDPMAAEPESSKAQKLARAIEIDDFRWLMGDPRGRRIAWRLLEMAGVFRSSFTGNSETFFREGARNMGLQIIAEIHALAPEQYLEMVKEQQQNG